MSDDIYFGPGTTPERVADAVQRAAAEQRDRPRRPAPSTAEREQFFKRIAEEIKRARGE